MKRNKKLWILVSVMMIVLGGYFLTVALTDKEPVSEDTGEVVTNFAVDEAVLLAWNYEGEDFSLSKTDGVWYNDADKHFPVAQNYPTAMASQISAITASRSLTGVTDLGQYGLEHPAQTVHTMTVSGGELSFVFGDTNSVTGEVYMQLSEGSAFVPNGTVYLVPASIPKAFGMVMDELVQFEPLPRIETINSVKVNGAEEYRLNYMGDDADVLPWVLRIGEEKYTADADACNALADALKNLRFIGCVSYDATATELSDYGLDVPQAVVTVEYIETDSDGNVSGKSLTISFGDADEKGGVVVSVDGMRMLYTVDSAVLDWIKSHNIAALKME